MGSHKQKHRRRGMAVRTEIGLGIWCALVIGLVVIRIAMSVQF